MYLSAKSRQCTISFFVNWIRDRKQPGEAQSLRVYLILFVDVVYEWPAPTIIELTFVKKLFHLVLLSVQNIICVTLKA